MRSKFRKVKAARPVAIDVLISELSPSGLNPEFFGRMCRVQAQIDVIPGIKPVVPIPTIPDPQKTYLPELCCPNCPRSGLWAWLTATSRGTPITDWPCGVGCPGGASAEGPITDLGLAGKFAWPSNILRRVHSDQSPDRGPVPHAPSKGSQLVCGRRGGEILERGFSYKIV